MSSQEQRSSHKRQRKKRLAVACESCRAKKEKCDRNVPGCSNCKRRKTICKWGDERDFHSSEAGSSIHSQPLDVTQDGLSIDMATAYRDTNVTSDTIEEFASLKPNNSAPSAQYIDPTVQSLVDRVIAHLPRRGQTRHLTQRFLELPHHIYYCIDVNEFVTSLDGIYSIIAAHQTSRNDSRYPTPPRSTSSPPSRPILCPVPLDELTRLLFVLTASAQQVAPSYHLALGTVLSADLVQPKIALWLEDALACFDTCHQQQTMSFAVLQAASIFIVWLGDCTPGYRYTTILDASMRAAIQLGLDRLASSTWDQQFITTKLPLMKQQKNTRDHIWAAKLLLQGDTKTRELGRSVWFALYNLMGSSPSVVEANDELATVAPGSAYQSEDYDPFDCWQHFNRLTPIINDWKKLQALTEATATLPDYQSSHQIYLRLQALERYYSPSEDLTDFTLRRMIGEPEEHYLIREKKTAQLAWSALLVQLKVLLIHRPLMGAGYRDVHNHGFSVEAAVKSANCILEGARRFRDMEWAHFGSIFGKGALMHATLAILLDLFHNPRSLDSGIGRNSYRLISVAIEQLKVGESSRHPSSILYKVGSRLEALMTACARHGSFHLQQQVQTQIDNTPKNGIMTDLAWLDHLDWQLFQAANGSHASSQADVNGQMWPYREASTVGPSVVPLLNDPALCLGSDQISEDAQGEGTIWDNLWSDIFNSIGPQVS